MEEKNENTNEMSEKELQALEDFYIKISQLDELSQIANKPNVFRVLKLEDMEIRHSNFLAWLFDPNENHGFGNKILKKFIKGVINEHRQIINNLNLKKITDLEKIDFYDFIVKREYANIDLLLVSEENKIVIAIENKVFTDEHSDQLTKYYDFITNKVEEYADFDKIFLYLTPDNREPKKEDDRRNWLNLNYDIIKNIIQFEMESIKKGFSNINERTKIYLEDYNEILRSITMSGDDKVKQICADIYKNNKTAIDLLIEYVQQGNGYIAEITYDALQKFKFDNSLDEIIVVSKESQKTYICFTTNKIINLLKDDNDQPIFQFVISNSKYGVSIAPELVSSKNDLKRKELHEKLNGVGPFKSKSTLSPQSHRLIKYELLLNDEKIKEIAVDDKIKDDYLRELKIYISKTTNQIKQAFKDNG
jgi:hypothetical protein